MDDLLKREATSFLTPSKETQWQNSRFDSRLNWDENVIYEFKTDDNKT